MMKKKMIVIAVCKWIVAKKIFATDHPVHRKSNSMHYKLNDVQIFKKKNKKKII